MLNLLTTIVAVIIASSNCIPWQRNIWRCSYFKLAICQTILLSLSVNFIGATSADSIWERIYFERAPFCQHEVVFALGLGYWWCPGLDKYKKIQQKTIWLSSILTKQKIPRFRYKYKYKVVFAKVLRYWWCPGFYFPINTLCKTPEICWIYKQALQQTNTLLDTKT